MAEAVKVIVEGAETGNIIDNDVNKELIDKCIYTSKSPNPDLLIRTSGEVRLSDFLLWQVGSHNFCITSICAMLLILYLEYLYYFIYPLLGNSIQF